MSKSSKKRLFEDMLDDVRKPTNTPNAINIDTSTDTPVYTSVNTPVNVNTSVSVIESEPVMGGVPVSTSVEASVNTVANADVIESENEETSTNIDISKYITKSVDVNEFQKQLKTKKQRVKFEDSHTKRTLWISKDLNKLLDMEVKNGGNITKEVNSALTLWFNLKSQGLV